MKKIKMKIAKTLLTYVLNINIIKSIQEHSAAVTY